MPPQDELAGCGSRPRCVQRPRPAGTVRSSPGPPASLRLEGLMSSAAQSVPRERWSHGVTLPPPGQPAPTASPCGSRNRGLRGEDRLSPGSWPCWTRAPGAGGWAIPQGGDCTCAVPSAPTPAPVGRPTSSGLCLAVGSSLWAPKPNKFPSDLLLLMASVRTRLPEATRDRQSSPGQTRRAAAPPRPPAGRIRTREGRRQAPQLLPSGPDSSRGI